MLLVFDISTWSFRREILSLLWDEFSDVWLSRKSCFFLAGIDPLLFIGLQEFCLLFELVQNPVVVIFVSSFSQTRLTLFLCSYHFIAVYLAENLSLPAADMTIPRFRTSCYIIIPTNTVEFGLGCSLHAHRLILLTFSCKVSRFVWDVVHSTLLIIK